MTTEDEFPVQFDLARAPSQPGCYLMKDSQGTVIYVGKAINLRARIRSYLNESDTRQTVRFLMRRVADIEFVVTMTEKEALLLENSLIKQFKPRYNVQLKDDKTYVSLCLNVRSSFPRLTVTRKMRKDGSRYFGPYSSASAVRDTLKMIQKLFPLRTCSDSVMANRARPCLYYQMKQCAAPCVGLISEQNYRELVQQVILVLEGKSGEVEKLLLERIGEFAQSLEFEKAAELRDRLLALRQTLEAQRAVLAEDAGDRDVFGLYVHGRYCQVQVLFYRGGRMMGGRGFSFSRMEQPVEEFLSSFLVQYYSSAPDIPREVLLPAPIDDADALADLLGDQRGARVQVLHPQRGEKKTLLELAARNARSRFEEQRLAEQANNDLLDQVAKTLCLARLPQRIECFDISTIQGSRAVGSMSVFEGGQPAKNRYRRFSIRHVEGQDDFAMLREVVLRRYRRAIEEDDLPDLVLVDGGKGQLGVVAAALGDLGLDDLPLASIAKSRTEEGGGHSPERFFIPGRANPIVPPQNSPIVHLLARIRDEAHRFAITYHRQKRAKSTLRTDLLDVPGVGPTRARALLKAFGSIEGVRKAGPARIAEVAGFNLTLAQAIQDHLDALAAGK